MYLRPRESMSVNTRLFYGVGQETKTEKSKYAYKLKVGYICLISVEGNNTGPGLSPMFYLRQYLY